VKNDRLQAVDLPEDVAALPFAEVNFAPPPASSQEGSLAGRMEMKGFNLTGLIRMDRRFAAPDDGSY